MQQLDIGAYSSMLHWPGFYFLSAFSPDNDFNIILAFVGLSGLLILYIWCVGVGHIQRLILAINVLSVTFSLVACMTLIYIHKLHVSLGYFYVKVILFFLGTYAKFADSLHFSFQVIQKMGRLSFIF